MRNLPANLLLALIPFLLVAGTVLAQAPSANDPEARPTTSPPAGKEAPPKPKPSELEQLLAEALVHNPDIRVAEAKLREAEAELNRVRFQVVQKVSTLHHAVEAQKSMIVTVENELLVGPPERRQNGALALAQEKAKLASLEAEFPAILGRPPQNASTDKTRGDSVNTTQIDFRLSEPPRSFSFWTGRVGSTDASPPVKLELAQGAMADKIRNALDRPVALHIQDKPLSEALKMIEEKAPGILFHVVLPSEQMAKMKVNLHLEQIPLGATLQALEDSFPEMRSQNLGRGALRLAVREYGILVTTQESLPPGAILLYDFWKRHPDFGKSKEGSLIDKLDNSTRKNPAPEDLEGVIKAIDPQSGLVTLSVGSDAGLHKGDTLEVYRLKPQPKYLGSVRILDVRPIEAVARPTSGTHARIEVGDQVAGRIRRR